MPLLKIVSVSKDTKALFWQVTETETHLHRDILLTPHCQNRFDGMRSEMHRRAFLSIRHLMALEGYSDADLYYNEFGKPFLYDGTHISISHSHNFTGIVLSRLHEVGIDIEMQRDKILRIAHKFTPIEEYRTLANTDALILKLTRVWCAKESLYKIYAQPGVSFLDHINVHDFSMDDPHTLATITYKGKVSTYQVDFGEFENFVFATAYPTNNGQ